MPKVSIQITNLGTNESAVAINNQYVERGCNISALSGSGYIARQ